jgi:hypothetical protein
VSQESWYPVAKTGASTPLRTRLEKGRGRDRQLNGGLVARKRSGTSERCEPGRSFRGRGQISSVSCRDGLLRTGEERE